MRSDDASAVESYPARRGSNGPTVMQVLPALNLGGVEQGAIDLNAYLVKAGWKSIVVSSGGKRTKEVVQAGGLHLSLPVHSKNPLTMYRNVSRLRRLIRQHNVDVVHACSRAPAWSARAAVHDTAARYITSCHAAHKITSRLKRLYSSSIAGGERVIAVSDFVSRYLQDNYKVSPAIIRVVHRGTSMERFYPDLVSREMLEHAAGALRIPNGAPVILLPARFTRSKGHKFLLDALKMLQRPDMICLFLGDADKDGAFKEEVHRYAADIGLGPQLRSWSSYDMPTAYMLADVVVAPSLSPEGFGRVPVEAQAMGRPIITTDHGGSGETVLRGETSWLIQPGNVDELASAIRQALDLDVATRQRGAVMARKHVEDYFSLEQMGKATLDVYSELLESPNDSCSRPPEKRLNPSGG